MKKLIPLSELIPDSIDYDQPGLRQAVNVMPIFNSYRSIKKPNEYALLDNSELPNGAHAHLVSKDVTEQKARPTGALVSGSPVTQPTRAATESSQVNEVDADDGDYCAERGAPSNATWAPALRTQTPIHP